MSAKAVSAKVTSGRGSSYTSEFAPVLQRVRTLYDQQLEQYTNLKPDNLKAGLLKKIGKRDRRIEHIAHLRGTADLGNSVVPVS
jgi:hypothetical protein